jgi:hypothetical protein
MGIGVGEIVGIVAVTWGEEIARGKLGCMAQSHDLVKLLLISCFTVIAFLVTLTE